MQYKMNYVGEKIQVEGRKDDNSNYVIYAGFDENSRIIYDGDLSDKICEEIVEFLKTQCIYIDENGIAYKLVN